MKATLSRGTLQAVVEPVWVFCSEGETKKAALPVMMEARPGGAKATGQFWKGQDQIWVAI